MSSARVALKRKWPLGFIKKEPRQRQKLWIYYVILPEQKNISRDCNFVLYVCVPSNRETEQTEPAELFAAPELHWFNQTESWDHV
jgi:hypothetical protein